MTRRLSPIARNAGTALCLTLCLASAALWIRSYRAGTMCEWRTPHGERYLLEGRGRIHLRVHHETTDAPAKPMAFHIYLTRYPEQADWEDAAVVGDVRHVGFAMFGYRRFTAGAPAGGGVGGWASPGWSITIPHWFLTLAPGAVVVASLRARVRRRRRVRSGRCPACGYDLRATPDRCPECGTIPPHPAAVRVGPRPPSLRRSGGPAFG